MRQLICPELLEKEPPRIAEEFYSVGRWRVQRATSAERAGATRLVSSWSRWIELPASWARLGEDFTASDFDAVVDVCLHLHNPLQPILIHLRFHIPLRTDR